MIDFLTEIDKELFLAINGLHNNFFDEIMELTSAKTTWIPVYLFMIFVLMKKYGRPGIILTLIIVVAVSTSDIVSVHFFKDVFQRLRPCHNPELQGLVHTVGGNCGGNFGFVSSHASNMFAVATLFYLLIRPFYKYTFIPLFVWATAIAYSRVYLGVHYPGDVVVGAMVGIIIGFLFYYGYILVKKKSITKQH